MYYLKERIEVIASQLKKLSVVNNQQVNLWQMKKGRWFTPQEAQQAPEPWEEFDGRSMHWYGPDKHCWFHTEYKVPENFDGKDIWMKVCTQIEEWDDAKNPQFLLFLNGEVVQGMDMNHREVLLVENAKAGSTLALDLQAYTGTLHSEFRFFTEVFELQKDIAGLYYDLQVPLWALERMPKDGKTRIDLIHAMNETINLLDMRNTDSSEFLASVKQARQYIAKALYQDLAGSNEVIASCIGHTHIDVAWWWTVEQTREKVARSFSTVLKLMDEYPDYKFMSSQPQLYQFLKERYPEVYEKVKQRVREGRWETEGGMWVEADCNLSSGEALIRQFMHGKQFFEEEFAQENKILWLPDVFGYSGALPQIMKKCGIDYFMTTKLSWNQFNKIPFDTFMWEGIDGTKVLTHFISTLGVGQSPERFFTTYNGMLHPDAIMGGWERYQNKELNNDILIAYGYGDGGGGPTREMLETSTRLEKGINGVPRVRQAFARQYFEELEEEVGENRFLPTWTGELYFEYHRGTYTSMARNKRSNRKSEFMLMDLELLASLANSKGLPYPRQQLDSMWKILLMNQFHDILPGSSIKEVYEVTKQEYDLLAHEAKNLIHERARVLAGEGQAVTVFNTLGFSCGDMVQLPEGVHALADGQGSTLPSQEIDGKSYVYLSELPAKGWRSYAKAEPVEQKSPFTVARQNAGHTITTPYFSVEIDQAGRFTSLYDKNAKRELAESGKALNQFRVYQDKPMYYDNWDIDIFYTESSWDLDKANVTVTSDGPLALQITTEQSFMKSKMVQKIRFYANTPRIDFETYVDWKESQHLLKVHFPLNLHCDEATFDIQFGNATRKTHTNTSWDQARFESCAHKWVDVSEGNYGVSLLNDCKYGHSVDRGDIGLTLIKSGIQPNPETDQEEHFFTYALYPHQGSWRQSDTQQEASVLNQPAFAVLGGEKGQEYSFAQMDQPNVVLETVKLAEKSDAFVLRIYESQNSRTQATLNLASVPAKVTECDMLENPITQLKTEGNAVSFEILPFEIKTLLVEF